MKNSIVFKTSSSIIIGLIVMFTILGFYSYNSQINIVNNLQKNQEKYIIDQLNRKEQLDIKKEKIILKNLINSIDSSISDALYNFDTTPIETTMNKLLKKENIKAFIIFDTTSNSNFLLGYKKDSKILLSEVLPIDIKNLSFIKSDLIMNNTQVGYIEVYYDNQNIIQSISRLKENDLKDFQNESLSISVKVANSVKNQIIGFSIGLILILTLIIFLLYHFVNKPLQLFKDGLESFFHYLSDSNKELKTIAIDTTDEFGQMTKSVNKSIDVTVKLHKDIKELNTNLELKVEKRTIELKKTNKKIKDSIQFASLIQQAILPQQEILDNYTTDNFTKWQPKDIVGGDIYFVVELDSCEEILVMVIDGAGHGVPGAFVTMLVKAIETQIVARIKEGSLSSSPAEILAYFNKSIKTMLKQEKGSKSNAGFDGGILYYNKTTKICKYAGAKTDLYIIDDNKLNIISGDKKNVGFVRTKIDQKYTEHTVTLKKDTKLYLSTDGVFDQEGKNKTRYGLDKFEEFLVEINNHPFEKQSKLIMESFNDFKKDINQTDDVTVVGLNFS